MLHDETLSQHQRIFIVSCHDNSFRAKIDGHKGKKSEANNHNVPFDMTYGEFMSFNHRKNIMIRAFDYHYPTLQCDNNIILKFTPGSHI